jgi:ABC-type uncharacterized transport system permease subunit
MISPPLIPIVLFICITYAIKAFLDTRVRQRMVSEGVGEDMVRSLLKEEEQRRRLGSLRWGVVLVALAIGFGIIQVAGWDQVNAGVIAVLAAATGLGNLAFFMAARRMQ